jgi:hypothetical protein
MAQQQAQSGQTSGNEAGYDEPKNDDVVDADFTETDKE